MKIIKLIIILSLISFFSCTKEEGEGGRASISGKLEGSVIQNSRAEVTEVICVPEDDIKNGDYWVLNTPGSADDYYIWYNNVAIAGGNPFIINRIGVQVDFSSIIGANNIDIAISTENALNAITGAPFSVTRINDKITITCKTLGAATDPDNGSSNMIVDVSIQGKDEIIFHSGAIADEDIFIVYGDKDDIYDDNIKTNYDGTFKFENLREGSYKIFAYNENKSIQNPLTPIFKTIEISGDEEGKVGTITIEKRDD